MKKLLQRMFGVNGDESAAMRLASKWECDSKEVLIRLVERRAELDELRAKLQSLSNRLEDDLRKAEQVEEQHRTAVEALRSENRILADVTVPTLVAQHKLILQGIESETAIQVRRQVAMGIQEIET